VSDTGVSVTLSLRDYDAVLFDLDDVLTRPASVHAVARKRLFERFRVCGETLLRASECL